MRDLTTRPSYSDVSNNPQSFCQCDEFPLQSLLKAMRLQLIELDRRIVRLGALGNCGGK